MPNHIRRPIPPARLLARSIAASEGRSTYNAGERCANGHVADRYMSNNSCTECARLGMRAAKTPKAPSAPPRPKRALGPYTLARQVVAAMRAVSCVADASAPRPTLTPVDLHRRIKALSVADRSTYARAFDALLCELRAEELNHIERLKAAP